MSSTMRINFRITNFDIYLRLIPTLRKIIECFAKALADTKTTYLILPTLTKNIADKDQTM